AAPGHRFADSSARAFARIESFARGPVAHQFHTHDQSDLADVTDGGQRPERFQFLPQYLFQFCARANRVACLKNLKTCQAGSRAELIGRVAVAVKKGFELPVLTKKRVEDFLRREGPRHRQITAGQTFRQTEEIRLDTFVMTPEQRSRRLMSDA